MGLASLLSLPETNAESAARVTPLNRLFFAGYAAGAAFQTSLPGKNNLLLFQDVILYRTDIKTGFITAYLTQGLIKLNMGRMIYQESYPGQFIY